MNQRLRNLILNGGYQKDGDGIYNGGIYDSSHHVQAVERKLRERVAAECNGNYLGKVASAHSIPVMDYEINRFLARMPENALILDIGGCWGWHWRKLAKNRPDVGVVIIDFIRANLQHAKQLLSSLVEDQVVLMHADATALPFSIANGTNVGFDGIWTVQVFQHIPNYVKACEEAHRVLKNEGFFVNYSFHITPMCRIIYRIFGKRYHTNGMYGDAFYLARANNEQMEIVEKMFGEVKERYTECLFHPDLRLGFTGAENSILGRFDQLFARVPLLGRWIARQRSFEAVKQQEPRNKQKL